MNEKLKLIKLENRNRSIIVDEHNFDRLSQFGWYFLGECIYRDFYTDKDEITGKRIHKLVSIAKEVMNNHNQMYDHIDRNPFNNTEINLRPCSILQNNINKSKAEFCSSEYKGVVVRKKKGRLPSIQACIGFNKKKIHLGSFTTEIEAAKAYDAKAKELYGEFACLNFS